MELQRKDKQELQQELSEFLQQYYDGSFSRMACDPVYRCQSFRHILGKTCIHSPGWSS